MSFDTLPAQLGPYKLLRRLGYGGMCEVFLAECYGASGFVKRVAIKTLLTEHRGQGRYERLLIHEATLGAMLTHRNLVQVHDLGIHQGTPYVRLDYVDGADLRALLQLERPSTALALHLIAEVALALDYLHGCGDAQGRPLGLVHRDVSPSNILLSLAGEVKLADLGIAKATKRESLTQGNSRKGKYAYMSPEQIRNQPLDPRSDLFSLGVTLMELLCGRRPYEGRHALETMELITSAQSAPALEDAPPSCQALLRRCLAPDPARRFPHALALYEASLEAAQSLERVHPHQLAQWVTRALGARDAHARDAHARDAHAPSHQTQTMTRTEGHTQGHDEP